VGSGHDLPEPTVLPALSVRELRKAFARGQPVLKGVDLDVHPGELVVVLGANGSGKSTLLRCAIRLIEPDSGRVTLAGQDMMAASGAELREVRRRAAMIFQQIHLVGRRSALENVTYGALGRIGGWRSLSFRGFPPDVVESAWRSLERVGLVDKAWQRASTLSGGQAQRVAVARGLCQQAEVILADEPVSALDPRAAEDVLALLADIARTDGLAVACVLHQPELARRYADRIVGIASGEVVFERTPATIQDSEIAHLYLGELDG
jgi:phosphonate transport system ATP-binding protein